MSKYHLNNKIESPAIATLVGGTKIKGRLTNDHPAVRFGRPIFVDDNGQAYPWARISSIRDLDKDDQGVIDGSADNKDS